MNLSRCSSGLALNMQTSSQHVDHHSERDLTPLCKTLVVHRHAGSCSHVADRAAHVWPDNAPRS